MPHIIVKLWPGKAEKQKQELADRITLAVKDVLNYSADSVSVSVEEISSRDWAKKVYDPEIVNGPGTLYKKPGYRM